MLAYHYDSNFFYDEPKECQIDPLATEEEGVDVWLLPADCTFVKPPEAQEGKNIKWTGTEWVYEDVAEPEPEPEPEPKTDPDPDPSNPDDVAKTWSMNELKSFTKDIRDSIDALKAQLEALSKNSASIDDLATLNDRIEALDVKIDGIKVPDTSDFVTTEGLKTASVRYATSASSANTASYASSAGSASSATKATKADSATYATSAGSATKANTATKADTAYFATKADICNKAVNADFATKSDTCNKAAFASNAGKLETYTLAQIKTQMGK